jgi:hypothetical protein
VGPYEWAVGLALFVVFSLRQQVSQFHWLYLVSALTYVATEDTRRQPEEELSSLGSNGEWSELDSVSAKLYPQ